MGDTDADGEGVGEGDGVAEGLAVVSALPPLLNRQAKYVRVVPGTVAAPQPTRS